MNSTPHSARIVMSSNFSPTLLPARFVGTFSNEQLLLWFLSPKSLLKGDHAFTGTVVRTVYLKELEDISSVFMSRLSHSLAKLGHVVWFL